MRDFCLLSPLKSSWRDSPVNPYLLNDLPYQTQMRVLFLWVDWTPAQLRFCFLNIWDDDFFLPPWTPSNSTCEPMEHQEFVKVWCYTMWCDSNAILCDAIPMRCDAIGLRLQLQLHTATLFFYSSFLSFFLIIIFFAFPGFLPVCVLPSSSYVFKLATNRTEKPINNDSEQQWCLADDSGAVANLLVESMADGGFRFILLVFF